jgi:hypothetical protein
MIDTQHLTVAFWNKKRGGHGRPPLILNFGGADRDRTDDLLNAIQALSQTELQPQPL